MLNPRKTELFRAMQACGRYENDEDIIDTIHTIREQVADGEDPEELLHEEGFEPDYIFDIIDI